MPTDIKNLKVGIVPAIAGFIVLVSSIVSGFTWVSGIESELDDRIDIVEQRIVVVETETGGIKHDLDEMKADIKAIRDHLMGN